MSKFLYHAHKLVFLRAMPLLGLSYIVLAVGGVLIVGTFSQVLAQDTKQITSGEAARKNQKSSVALLPKHKRPIAEERLESLFNTESISYLLNHNEDALRRGM